MPDPNKGLFLFMKRSSEDNIIDVATGEVKVSAKPVTLRAMAIGSCVAVVAYDSLRKIGGLAHIMLPGEAPPRAKDKTKYAISAIDSLLSRMHRRGAKRGRVRICLIGGANIFESTVPKENYLSISNYFKNLGMKIAKKRIGGMERRSVCLDISSGEIFYTESNSAARSLLGHLHKGRRRD